MPGFELFGNEERKEVQDVLKSGALFRYGFDDARDGHWKAKSLEDELARRFGVAHCHVCSSGTSALGIALAACGIGAGDEVIVPPFTFIATIEAVLSAGAVPVFADVDDTLCLDPDAARRAIGPRTKAVLPVHMCGSMARIAELSELCRERGLRLIEDSAQAVGATFEGRAAGTVGDIGCYSFDAVKTITCGEGGAIVTDDPTLYERADQFSDHGHDHLGSDRGMDGHPILGTNHRISELNAAVGLAQLRKLDRILEIQRGHQRILREVLSRYDEISFRVVPDPAGDSATFLTFLLPDEERAREVASALGRSGVDGCFYWYDNNWHYLRNWAHLKELRTAGCPALQLLPDPRNYHAVDVAHSDRLLGRTISMAIKLSWTRESLDERVKRISEVFSA